MAVKNRIFYNTNISWHITVLNRGNEICDLSSSPGQDSLFVCSLCA